MLNRIKVKHATAHVIFTQVIKKQKNQKKHFFQDSRIPKKCFFCFFGISKKSRKSRKNTFFRIIGFQNCFFCFFEISEKSRKNTFFRTLGVQKLFFLLFWNFRKAFELKQGVRTSRQNNRSKQAVKTSRQNNRSNLAAVPLPTSRGAAQTPSIL